VLQHPPTAAGARCIAVFAWGRAPSQFVFAIGDFGMLKASPRERRAISVLAAFFAVFVAATASAQTINLSLNVFYNSTSNANSGGTWELVGKSSDFGIAGLDVKLKNIATAQNRGPRATVNGANSAGFSVFAVSPDPQGFTDLTIGQNRLDPLPPGNEQTAFYGVGTLTNGAPNYPGKPAGSNSIGPLFTSLTNPQQIPWATGDAFSDPTWATAARFASGTFNANFTPSFFAGSSGNVFTSVGTSTAYGAEVLASALTTIVRTNLVALNADYNHNGLVDAADYVLWRQQLGTNVPNGTGADGDGNGIVNQLDYDLWRSHFGLTMGAGGSLSTGAVPEPTTCILLAAGAILSFGSLRRRARAI
jgi:hypothetical protein